MKPWTFPSLSLCMVSKTILSAIILSICDGGNASPAATGGGVALLLLSLGASAAGETVAHWTSLRMDLNDGAIQKTVLIRDGADEAEVSAVIAEGCREAGVTDDQASSITSQWIAQEWKKQNRTERMGYQRTGFMFEDTGSKHIFERFLGRMATLAEEQPVAVLETGSWEGASALWIAEHLLKHPSSLLVCLDSWDGGTDKEKARYSMAAIEERFHWNMAKAPNSERVIAVKGDSLESLAGLLARGLISSFDAVYIDASHEMKDVLGDALLSFRLLKVGGIMMFDDYWMRGVARATVAFEEALGNSLTVLHRDINHLVVTKVANDRFATHDSELVLGDDSRLEKLAGSKGFNA
ncbi:unnamed protein product [Pylaiella littoralis]